MYRKEYYDQNKEKFREYQKSYRKKNPEKIIEYLKERGYNTSRNINNKELYLNFDKVEKGVQRNIFQDELKIRGDFANTKYKNLLEKNNILSKQLEDNTLKYKKMICEKNMDKIDV